ncbi:O-methyltransferase-domain-containing protein [Amylocarpus encephaloides]|uniref:O-methyltransferase-domain-containing protein n=1 Tax=Amylocarpus encephaloides TaxID=45428 RepID=A0A9P7YCT0_9HELO|nr:O-methyltransferase-domain-containing protein [Amylocarpus encephaloides]
MAPQRSTSSLIALAATISKETEKLEKYMKDSGIPAPSFDVNSPLDFPKLPADIRSARENVMAATKELGDLLTGPRESIRWMAWDHNNSLSLQAIYHYKIAKSFLVNGTATYAEIAASVGLDEVNVRRFMRHAMTNRIFREVNPDEVAHTAASRVLAEDEVMNDWVGFCTSDIFPAGSRVIQALTEHSSASEPTQTGFCTANNTTNIEPMFATFGKDPKRAKRMGGAMTSLTGGEGYELSYLLDNYDWASLNAKKATIVDVGGSHGFVCAELASRYPDLKFVVQDLPKTVNSAPKFEGDLASRIEFQAHDFFTEQPVQGADIYLFRWIFHNYSDKYATKILRSLIPAFKKGSKVLINDHCLKDGFGLENMWDEKIIRTMDLVMLTLLNATERSESQYKTLFANADPGFRFAGVERIEGCRMAIVEAVWEGTS